MCYLISRIYRITVYTCKEYFAASNMFIEQKSQLYSTHVCFLLWFYPKHACTGIPWEFSIPQEVAVWVLAHIIAFDNWLVDVAFDIISLFLK